MNNIEIFIFVISLILIGVVVFFNNRVEKYSNFDCVSVYGNQPEFLRCVQQVDPNCSKQTMEGFEGQDYPQLNLSGECKDQCMEECAIEKGTFNECCARCMMKQC